MATEPKGDAMDDDAAMMGEWRLPQNRFKRLTVPGCCFLVVVAVVQLVALFRIGDNVTALRILLDPEFAALRRPESDAALGSAPSFIPVSRPSLRSDAGENARLKEENQRLEAALARVRDELDRVRARSTDESETKAPPYIALPPGTTGVRINVGANYEPLVECDANETIVCFLFDIQNKPVQYLREQYRDNANMYIFTLGISDFDGLAAFPILGYGGASSKGQSTSLSDPSKESAWNTGENRGGMDWSGVISLAQVIDSIDPTIPILMLATDMQGHDFTAIVSAGNRLKRVQELQVELYKDGVATYAGVRNDYESDWLPYMTELGFVEENCTPGYVRPGEANEWDCLWRPAT